MNAPDVDVVVRSEYADLVRWNPSVSTLYDLDVRKGVQGILRLRRCLRKNAYAAVYDLHDSLRSRLLRWRVGRSLRVVRKFTLRRWLLVRFKINLLRAAPPVTQRYLRTIRRVTALADPGLELHIPDDVWLAARSHAPVLTVNRPIVGLAPGAKHGTKMWLEDRFASVGSRLVRELGVRIYLFGGPEDAARCARIEEAIRSAGASDDQIANLAGRLSLLESASFMDDCTVLVTNDTGLMHMASARKRPVVAVFGPTVREFGFFPQGPEDIVIERAELNCRPCSHIGGDHCPLGHFRCMREIGVDDVLDAVAHVLGSHRL